MDTTRIVSDIYWLIAVVCLIVLIVGFSSFKIGERVGEIKANQTFRSIIESIEDPRDLKLIYPRQPDSLLETL